MPDNENDTPLALEWLPFTKGVRSLLVPQPDDRPLDQYLAFRDQVLAMVQDRTFLDALNQQWTTLNTQDTETKRNATVLNALVAELKAFTLAQEVAQATEKNATESKGWWSKFLDRASTTIASAKDLLDTLPWYAKNSLTLFKELIDLFRAKA